MTSVGETKKKLTQFNPLPPSCVFLTFNLDCEKLCEIVESYDEVDVGVYIYVNWIVNVVGDCIYVK